MIGTVDIVTGIFLAAGILAGSFVLVRYVFPKLGIFT